MRSPVPLASFRPRLLSALQGYDRGRFLHDLGAGATVGIVALPLAMAFAIASGLKPEAGLWTAIIAGLLIAALGGSNVQIGGPAGAFIVLIFAAIVATLLLKRLEHGEGRPGSVLAMTRTRIGSEARRTRLVTQRDVELFTEITGDRNPLHYDPDNLGYVINIVRPHPVRIAAGPVAASRADRMPGSS